MIFKASYHRASPPNQPRSARVSWTYHIIMINKKLLTTEYPHEASLDPFESIGPSMVKKHVNWRRLSQLEQSKSLFLEHLQSTIIGALSSTSQSTMKQSSRSKDKAVEVKIEQSKQRQSSRSMAKHSKHDKAGQSKNFSLYSSLRLN